MCHHRRHLRGHRKERLSGRRRARKNEGEALRIGELGRVLEGRQRMKTEWEGDGRRRLGRRDDADLKVGVERRG
jgi:hypothetical protein